ncbi:hypothetical protein GINT2_001020 [Glugoides intestinalis]
MIRKGFQLMIEKEKEYVEMCFNKSFNAYKTDIDYGSVLDGKQIRYSGKQDKKEIKMLFGKRFRTSKKYFREAVNTESSFLDEKLTLSQFFEIITVLKYLELEVESKLEIEQSIIDHLKENFSVIIGSEKTFKYLEMLCKLLSEDSRFELLKVLFENSELIRNSDLLFDLLDKQIDNLPANESFINERLWKNDSGYILAVFLVLKEKKLIPQVLESFANSKTIECRFQPKFLAIMSSMCDEAQKKILDKKKL